MMITDIKGVGPKKSTALSRLGVETLKDLVYLFPKTYQDRREITAIKDLEIGKEALIYGSITKTKSIPFRGGKKGVFSVEIADASHSIELVFFNGGYLNRVFATGNKYFVFGEVGENKGRLQLVHPEFSKENIGGCFYPIYSLTAGISQKEMVKWQKNARAIYNEIPEHLPRTVIQDNNLCSITEALEYIHFPENKEKLEMAKKRFIFDDLFFLALGMALNKEDSQEGIAFSKPCAMEEFVEKLPFKLTEAQQKVAKEIMVDMESNKAMNRLLQGDVGSGKTVVAEIALYKAVKNGYQGAFMAPTEILAKQHYESLKDTFEGWGIKVACLLGSMTQKEKKEIVNDLGQGEINIIIGTHALIQDSVEFKKLGIVITDEQHRFGVKQRMKLHKKGNNPDVLVVTATPIPRTLAVVLYGEVDVSVIDSLPPGRVPIDTKAVKASARSKVYEMVAQEVAKGRQAYVVAPLIEKSESIDARNVMDLYEELRGKFLGDKINIGLLHGELTPAEKDATMEAFARGHIQVLVSTVVIEVGINVPNATIMVIENSERFGLAQLHQLRGRVGRGAEQSYCVLILDSLGEVAIERARTMVTSSDGFYIAEKDLELRGPGEFFGNRQHGIPDRCLTSLVSNMELMDKAKKAVIKILTEDPLLDGKETKVIRNKLEEFFDLTHGLQL